MTTDSSAQTDATRVACQAFSPISWASKDTPLTIVQVKEHNAVYTGLCIAK